MVPNRITGTAGRRQGLGVTGPWRPGELNAYRASGRLLVSSLLSADRPGAGTLPIGLQKMRATRIIRWAMSRQATGTATRTERQANPRTGQSRSQDY
jgi:hypothetical protein